VQLTVRHHPLDPARHQLEVGLVHELQHNLAVQLTDRHHPLQPVRPQLEDELVNELRHNPAVQLTHRHHPLDPALHQLEVVLVNELRHNLASHLTACLCLMAEREVLNLKLNDYCLLKNEMSTVSVFSFRCLKIIKSTQV
jgi:hypothetical protein